MVINFKVLWEKENGQGKVHIVTQLVIITLVTLRQGKSMVLEKWYSSMEMYIKVFGKVEWNMEEGSTIGKMGYHFKENFGWINVKGKE